MSVPHVARSTGNYEWITPPQYIEAARKVMGSIDLDPASSAYAQTIVNATRYYTISDNGLIQDWHSETPLNIWLNPPYSNGLVGQFIDKLMLHCHAGDVNKAIVLVNNATETGWFSRLVSLSNGIVFPDKRIKYWGPEGELKSPLQGQAFVYYGAHVTRFFDVFEQFGWCAVAV